MWSYANYSSWIMDAASHLSQSPKAITLLLGIEESHIDAFSFWSEYDELNPQKMGINTLKHNNEIHTFPFTILRLY